MTAWIALAFAAAMVLVAWSWAFARRATYAQGKADAFRQVADDFHGLSRASWMRDAERRRAEQKKRWLRLCLCTPDTRDALREALDEADEFWAGGRTGEQP
jgi:hypothetical protein